MDAYSMTFTSPTVRHVSRIYQDLKSTHFQDISSLSSKQIEDTLDIMGSKVRVSRDSLKCLDIERVLLAVVSGGERM